MSGKTSAELLAAELRRIASFCVADDMNADNWKLALIAVSFGAPTSFTFGDDGTDCQVSLLNEALTDPNPEKFESVGGQLFCIRYLMHCGARISDEDRGLLLLPL